MTLQLENYGVSELSHSEQREMDGGINWGKVWKVVDTGLRYIGYYDAVSDFKEGFSEGAGKPGVCCDQK